MKIRLRPLFVWFGLFWTWGGLHGQTPVWQAFTTIEASPDQKFIATGGLQGELRIWDLRSGEPVSVVSTGDASISGLSWIESSCYAVTLDGFLHRYKPLDDSRSSFKVSNQPLRAIVANSSTLWIAGDRPEIAVLDATTLKTLRTITTTHRKSIKSLALDPGKTWISSSSDDGTVEIHDLSTGKLVSQWAASKDWVRSVRWTDAGLWTASDDGFVQLWSPQGKLRTKISIDDRPMSFYASSSDWYAGTFSGNLIWGNSAAQEVHKIRLHDAPILGLGWDNGTSSIVTASLDFRMVLFAPKTNSKKGEISFR